MGIYGLGSKTVAERVYGAPLYPSVDTLQKRQNALLKPPSMSPNVSPSIVKYDKSYAAYSDHSPLLTSGVTASRTSAQFRFKPVPSMLCPRRRRQW